MTKMKTKEAEFDSANVKVINDLKAQLRKEKQKVEKVVVDSFVGTDLFLKCVKTQTATMY